MIRWFMKSIASFLRYFANLCDPAIVNPMGVERILAQKETDACIEHEKAVNEWLLQKDKERIRRLLARDDLSDKESEELAGLVAKCDGHVIFLDPVGAEKEHL